jgi:uncharacterized repeat protein (TIGR03803 family)
MKSFRVPWLAVLMFAACVGAQAAGASLAPIYTFGTNGPNDGADPAGALAVGAGGVLYGTTTGGGAYGYGTVFSLTPPSSSGGNWTEGVIWSFGGSSEDGRGPGTGVVVGSDGTLYGVTKLGGSGSVGVVFSLTPPAGAGEDWSEAVLYTFDPTVGGYPRAGLTVTPVGTLYGTTDYFAFSLAPPTSEGATWTETSLWTFGLTPGDGVYPSSPLVIDRHGVLYGTTQNGGANSNGGTVFTLTPPASGDGGWTEAILWSFGAQGDGAGPVGVTVGTRGELFVVTGYSVPANRRYLGDVVVLAPPGSQGGIWTETILHKFGSQNGGKDGVEPRAGVLLERKSGDLYGVTDTTAFEMRPPSQTGRAWRFVLMPAVGGDPYGPLTRGSGGALYGVAASSGGGFVFSLVP